MFATATLVLVSASVMVAVAAVLIGLELDRRHRRQLVSAVVCAPQAVEEAWVSAPDSEGLRRLFVKTTGAVRPQTVAMDFEVDEVVRRFSLAGIRVGFEHTQFSA